MNKKDYEDLIKKALEEDLGDNSDVTSESIFTEKQRVTFKLLAKDDGVLCGSEIFKEVFKQIEKDAVVEFYFKDGDPLKKGDITARVTADVVTLLKGERTALNFISHLSGIASKTSRFVKAADGKLKILDTRKTIPGLRVLQKYAVFCGGGDNHRMGLFDMVLIKDNHIDAAGSITRAVEKVRKKWGSRFKIEVETRNLKEVSEALGLQVDRIMLDNMDLATMTEACRLIGSQAETEASGNMTLERIAEVARTGVGMISFGELTHTIDVFDFSLKKEKDL